jgi:hypothetical protein
MPRHPILLVGGSGVIGRWTARLLRAAHPDAPLLIGGRDRVKTESVAAGIGHAEGVVLDLAAEDLGLGTQPVSAVAIFFKDDSLAALHFAQARGVPHMSISSSIHEIGPEVAAYMHRPSAMPVVLGAEWLVGATTIPALEAARTFGEIDDVSIGALLDEQDTGGPAAALDVERLIASTPAALTRRGGNYIWRSGDDAKVTFRAADGTVTQADALAPYDVVGLATALGAPNVQFNLAMGISSSRRRGEPFSTEIVIELSGRDHAGKPLRTRHAVVHPEGQMPLTGLGVAMVLERLAGLGGQPKVAPGLYFPYQLLEPETYLARLKQAGGTILRLDAET